MSEGVLACVRVRQAWEAHLFLGGLFLGPLLGDLLLGGLLLVGAVAEEAAAGGGVGGQDLRAGSAPYTRSQFQLHKRIILEYFAVTGEVSGTQQLAVELQKMMKHTDG